MSYRQQTYGPSDARSINESIRLFKTTDAAQNAADTGRFPLNSCAKIESNNLWVANYDGLVSTIERLPLIDGSLPLYPTNIGSCQVVTFDKTIPFDTDDTFPIYKCNIGYSAVVSFNKTTPVEIIDIPGGTLK